MTSAEPARPAVPQAREVKASVLAAFQLVEDADRKLARDLRAS
jgi:hypothetical protein